jgi:hypothetical protein
MQSGERSGVVQVWGVSGMERHETGEQKAEQLVRSGLKQLHWTEADLESRPKGHKSKVKLERVFKITLCRILS